MGAAADDREGDPARGHRADADQPDARGHATARCDDVRPWDTLSDDEKRLFARMAEVYAGFSEYTDPQVGRIVDYLEESGQLDNTIIFYCADNGASGEGSPNGSVNENKFFNGWPDDDRGEPDASSTSSAARTPTTTTRPAGRWRSRRRSGCSSATPTRAATCDPLVIHWPKGIEARGEVRHQYHHATDIVPTILDCCGVEFPTTVERRRAVAAAGRVDALLVRRAPTRRRRRSASTTRCSAPAASGTRAGRRSPCTGRPPGIGHFDEDRWQLFHTDEDRSEAHDLAEEHPEKLKELIELWFEEADKYDVLPLDDRHPFEILADRAPAARARARHVHLLPGHRRGAGGRGAPTSAGARTGSSPRSRSRAPTPRA